jgi:cyclopropane fatty-acyl-phospholipid synthase-like methyltransferase
MKYKVTKKVINESYNCFDELISIERNLYKYNRHICSLFLKRIKPDSKVLDFGAGIGTIAKLFKPNINVECLEIDDSNRKKILNNKTYSKLSDIKKVYDVIYSSNVLEHIKNDSLILKKINEKLKSQGILTLYLPAHQSLYSHLDRTLGHFRRYEKKELILKLQKNNFKILDIHYVDSLGYFLAILMKLKKTNKHILMNEKLLKFYDIYLFPISLILDSCGFKFITGKNIFVVAQKI